jgi:uncharacterized iron-regulated protein
MDVRRYARLIAPVLFLVGCAAMERSASVESPYVAPGSLRPGQILHLATGRLLTEAEALDYVSRFPVVYVGEEHDNADAHAVQMAVLRAMQERFPGQVAVGLEMLQRPFQPDADAFVRGEMSERDFQRVWQKSWSDFFVYREMLLFVRDNKIPLVALNASTAMRQAVREQAPSAPASGAARDLPDMDMQDRYHRAFIEAILGRHANGTGGAEALYRVQVLWDETMAQTAAEYLEGPAGRGRRLLVFAGGNHVRYGFGIPRRVFRRIPLPYAIVEPYVNMSAVDVPREKLMDVDTPTVPLRPADIYWSVGYRDLKDQQVKLGILIEDSGHGGARVTGVMPDAPGHAAGLVTGDVIISLDGAEVNDAADLIYEVGRHTRGQAGSIEVLRGGERVRLPVTYDVIRHGKH